MSGNGGWARAFRAVAFVTAVPVSVGLAGAIGSLLDRGFGGGWWFTILAGLFGFGAGIYQLFRGLRQLRDDDTDHDPP